MATITEKLLTFANELAGMKLWPEEEQTLREAAALLAPTEPVQPKTYADGLRRAAEICNNLALGRDATGWDELSILLKQGWEAGRDDCAEAIDAAIAELEKPEAVQAEPLKYFVNESGRLEFEKQNFVPADAVDKAWERFKTTVTRGKDAKEKCHSCRHELRVVEDNWVVCNNSVCLYCGFARKLVGNS